MKTYCKPLFNVSKLTVEERLAGSGMFDTNCSTIYYNYSIFNVRKGVKGVKGTYDIDRHKDGSIDKSGSFWFIGVGAILKKIERLLRGL